MSAPQWHAEIAVDADIARRLIARVSSELASTTIERFGNGWDNTAFLVDGRFVFRFPRRALVTKLLQHETVVLAAIAREMSLSVPVPTYFGTPSDLYPWPYTGYALINGRTACAFDLDTEDRERLALPLGAFLRELHDIDVAPFVDAGIPNDEMGRFDHATRFPRTQKRFALLCEQGIADSKWGELIDWMEAHPPQIAIGSALRLVHGDLYARHVILDEARSPVGIIDWGDVHIGDPAIDLTVAHQLLPPSAQAAFLSSYGPVDDRASSAARYRAIYAAFVHLEYGSAVGDADLTRAARYALQTLSASR